MPCQLSQVLPCITAWDGTPLQTCTFGSNLGCLHSCDSLSLCGTGAFQAVAHQAAGDRSSRVSHTVRWQVPFVVALAMAWLLAARLASGSAAISSIGLQAASSRSLP